MSSLPEPEVAHTNTLRATGTWNSSDFASVLVLSISTGTMFGMWR